MAAEWVDQAPGLDVVGHGIHCKISPLQILFQRIEEDNLIGMTPIGIAEVTSKSCNLNLAAPVENCHCSVGNSGRNYPFEQVNNLLG